MKLLEEIYNAETFRKEGHWLVDQLADNMISTLEARKSVNEYLAPEDQLEKWKNIMKSEAPWRFYMEKLIDGSIKLHHPHYMGHQVSPPAPMAALGGLVSDFLSNGMGVYEMGGPATAIERLMIQEIANAIGYGENADGILTSGGTLANLTGLLTARSQIGGLDVWQDGNRKESLAIMVSAQAHYCVDRAIRIMGLGASGIIKVPVDHEFRIRIERLEEVYQKAQSQGFRVFAIVGSACTTSTGTYDDLAGISAFANKHSLWFHVDGAHGGAAVFSTKYQQLVEGIEEADSVAIDCHKMMMTPALATGLVYKNGLHSYATFHQEAKYLFAAEEQEWHNLAKRTFECTKLMMSIKFMIIIKEYGRSGIDAFVTTLYDLGRQMGQKITQCNQLELATKPDSNIVCFRYVGEKSDLADLNKINLGIRQKILSDGRYYIVKTVLQEKVFLRCTLMNPFTSEEVIEALLGEVIETAKVLA